MICGGVAVVVAVVVVVVMVVVGRAAVGTVDGCNVVDVIVGVRVVVDVETEIGLALVLTVLGVPVACVFGK